MCSFELKCPCKDKYEVTTGRIKSASDIRGVPAIHAPLEYRSCGRHLAAAIREAFFCNKELAGQEMPGTDDLSVREIKP